LRLAVATMTRMKPARVLLPILLIAFCSANANANTDAATERTPQDTVKLYLSAMQNHKFDEAYDYVSSTLRGGKDREAWAKEQKYIVEVGEVKIFSFKTYPAIITGDKAKVPNLLKSQDKFLNQLGLDEHEVYELVKEDGQWRIDNQTLVEGEEQKEYFPDE